VHSVGFVGFGEAAKCFARAISDHSGFEVTVFCDGTHHTPPYDPAFLAELADHHAVGVESMKELVSRSEVVFSAVTVDQAEQVGAELLELANRGQLVVDVNASTPSVKARLGTRASAAGVRYVDANLMGAVSIYGHRVQLLSSGTGASSFQADFEPLGFNIEVLDGQAGKAAAVKMLRSVVTKGMEALLVEALTAARALGIVDDAFAGICGPMDATTYSDFAVMCIKTDVLHAGRRAVEMDDIATELTQMGIDPVMTKATTRRLAQSANYEVRDEFLKRPSYDYHDVLDVYHEVTANRAVAEGREVH